MKIRYFLMKNLLFLCELLWCFDLFVLFGVNILLFGVFVFFFLVFCWVLSVIRLKIY